MILRRNLILIPVTLASFAILLTGCSGGGDQGAWAPPPIPVEATQVLSGKVVDQFATVGTIEAIDAITVVSELDALVREITFREGSFVEKGELLVQLDDTQLKAEHDKQEALLQQNKVTFDRKKALKDGGAVTAQEYDDAYADYKVAEAELAMIDARLAKTKITAPFSGMVGARRVSPGAKVSSLGSTSITDLVNLDRLKVTFSAPERFLSQLKKGAEVRVTTTAFPGYELTGSIQVIEPVIDKATRSARMIAHINNPEHKLYPGMSANVSAVLTSKDNALMIPDEAVFSEGDQTFVFVINADSSVARTPVTLGIRQPESVEVLTGLTSGQSIVTAGHQKIIMFGSAKVIPMPRTNGAPGQPPAAGGSAQ